MADIAGYYKLDGNDLLFGRRITNKAYSLDAKAPTKPGEVTGGWGWFESEELARKALLCEKALPTPEQVCLRSDCKERIVDSAADSAVIGGVSIG